MPNLTEQTEALSLVWHRLVVLLQKIGGELWKDHLAGISSVEIGILNLIQMMPKATTKELIQAMQIPGSTLTNAINRLEKRRLIQRKINDADRRLFRLELTEKGIATQVEHVKGEEILWQRIFSAFHTDEERKNLIDTLNKLADSL